MDNPRAHFPLLRAASMLPASAWLVDWLAMIMATIPAEIENVVCTVVSSEANISLYFQFVHSAWQTAMAIAIIFLLPQKPPESGKMIIRCFSPKG